MTATQDPSRYPAAAHEPAITAPGALIGTHAKMDVIGANRTTGRLAGSASGYQRTAAGPLSRGRRGDLAFVLVLWLVSRVLFEGIAGIVRALGVAVPDSRPGFFGWLFNWDSGDFACIAENGYGGAPCHNVPNAAKPSYLPGYPLLARALSAITGGGHHAQVTAALWAIPLVASLVAAWSLYRLVDERWGRRPARCAVALLLLGPYGVFLAASYSEALFLALAIPAWRAASRERYVLAGLLAAGASFVRINGLFLVLGLAVLVVGQQVRQRTGLARTVAGLLSVAIGALGTGSYFLWSWAATGHLNAWGTSQSTYYRRRTLPPWETLYKQLKGFRRQTHFDVRVQLTAELLAVVVVVSALVWLLRRRAWAEAVYVAASAAAFLTSTSYWSLARGTLVMFPLFAAGGAVIARARHRTVASVVVGLLFAMAVYNGWSFATGHWTD